MIEIHISLFDIIYVRKLCDLDTFFYNNVILLTILDLQTQKKIFSPYIKTVTSYAKSILVAADFLEINDNIESLEKSAR